MIASWMLYTLCVGALLAVAAYAGERALLALGKPVRFAWAAALALGALWPVAPSFARFLPQRAQAVTVMPFTIVVQAPTITADAIAAARRAMIIDRALTAVWIALTLLLIARLVRGSLMLARSRSAWKRARVNGVRVKLSDNVGPAVVGLRTMDVVLPEWILSLDEPLREIVLRHEDEHRKARDPYLLFAAAALVALMPWNVALWFIARRLRLAIEMDCDARVLRAHPSPERYGMLILTIAQRRSIAPVPFAPMLTEPATNLERRILAMRSTKKVARVTAIGGGLVTVGVLAFASSLQSASTTYSRPAMLHEVAVAAARVVPQIASVPRLVLLPKVVSVPAVEAETLPALKKRIMDSINAANAARTSVAGRVLVPSAHPTRTNEVLQLQPIVSTAVDQGNHAIRNPAPEYPSLLRAAELEGAVTAAYSFDARGNVDPSSIRIVSSTHDLLTNSVKRTLTDWHGTPNTSAQTPFVFVLSNKSAKDLTQVPGGISAGAMVIQSTPAPNEQTSGPQSVNPNQTFFEFQVEQQVTPKRGNRGPRYPDEMRAAGIEGEVLAQFVVDQYGEPDLSTLKILKSTDDAFTESVRSAIPDMHFNAALVGDRNVKQLIQMPFQFNLSKNP